MWSIDAEREWSLREIRRLRDGFRAEEITCRQEDRESLHWAQAALEVLLDIMTFRSDEVSSSRLADSLASDSHRPDERNS